jgi:hypothetical protein
MQFKKNGREDSNKNLETRPQYWHITLMAVTTKYTGKFHKLPYAWQKIHSKWHNTFGCSVSGLR